MTKIFKQLARHWAVCLVVFALLFVQAYCDLSLPDYTSRIVDTGIQQGGIESPLPEIDTPRARWMPSALLIERRGRLSAPERLRVLSSGRRRAEAAHRPDR